MDLVSLSIFSRSIRLSAAGMVAFILVGAAQEAAAQASKVVWKGSYTCGQGQTGVTVTVEDGNAARSQATFSFYPLPGSSNPSGEYTATLNRPSSGTQVSLSPGQWVRQPGGYTMVGFKGTISADGMSLSGRITSAGCRDIRLTRDGSGQDTTEATAPTAPQPTRAEPAPERAPPPVPQVSRQPLPRPMPGTRNARELEAASARDASLIGGWDGAIYYPNRGGEPKAVRISLDFSPTRSTEPGASLDVRLDHPTLGNAEYVLLRKSAANGEIAKANASEKERGSYKVFQAVVHQQSIQKDPSGREILNLRVIDNGEPVAYLTRREGKGGSGPSFRERCANVYERWFSDRFNSWDAARKLKVQFLDGLKRYDEKAASLNEALTDPVFRERFGTSIAAMNTAGFGLTLREARDCSLTMTKFLRDELMDGIIDVRSTQREWNLRTSPSWMWKPQDFGYPTNQAAAVKRQQAVKEAEDRLPELLKPLESISSIGEIDAVLAANVAVLNDVRPSVLSAALEPTVARLREIRTSDAAAIAQERQRKAAERMQSVTIPAAVLASPRANLITAVVQGKVPRLSGEAATYFGGMMASSIGRCGIPASAATRVFLGRILMTAMDRTLLGTAYGDSDLTKTIGSSVAGQAQFIEGVSMAKTIGCDPFLDVLAMSLVETSATTNVAADGRADNFVRTCSLERPRDQCECIVREASAIIPGLAQETYSRNVFPRITNGNPIASGRMALVCRVGNY